MSLKVCLSPSKPNPFSINRAFNSEYISGKLRELTVDRDGKQVTVDVKSVECKLLSSGKIALNAMETDKFDSELAGDKTLLNAPDGTPAERQPVFDRSNPDANILERVGAAVKDASAFLNDSAEDAKESAVTDLNPLQK